MRLPEFRAWIRKDKKMMGVKLIGGGYCWLDDVWIDSKTNLNATAHEIGVTCDVSEWTGLRDKQGNKIFEGDIMMIDPIFRGGGKAKIVFTGSGFYSVAGDGEKEILSGWPIKAIEVIGNVWENPELLERK